MLKVSINVFMVLAVLQMFQRANCCFVLVLLFETNYLNSQDFVVF